MSWWVAAEPQEERRPMSDITADLRAVERETGARTTPAGEGHSVLLRRRYAAAVEEVWDAITDPQRVARWFLPVSGDFRLGGAYQLEGNAGGTILRCDRPHLLRLSWVMGEAPAAEGASEVEVRLAAVAPEETELVLDHTAVVPAEMWDQFGPGAVGVGWDLTLLGLAMHLRGEAIADHDTWEASPEARRYIVASSVAWGEALRAAGAPDEAVAGAVRNTTAFYAPEPDAAGEGAAGEGAAATSAGG
jgi:uncharacterized protein YndB with AHSA1/START domain